LSWIENAKKRAAIESVKLVEDGQIIGLGTGSTAGYMIEQLGKRIREEKLRVLGVPTSNWTSELAKNNGIPLTTLDEHPQLDIAIDGADQVDPDLNLIKGLGGALTREKIVDTAAKDLIIIVDESKLVERLGLNHVIPVEVLPMARAPVMKKLRKLNGSPAVRFVKDKSAYFITDNGNYIIDVIFSVISNIKKLETDINMISGVVENGLFIGVAEVVFVGYKSEVKKLKKR